MATATLGGTSSTLGGSEVPGYGASAPANVSVRTLYLQVTINGTVQPNVVGARVSLGFDLGVAEATVTFATTPSVAPAYNGQVQISMGAGINNAPRFSGLVKEWDYSLYPRAVTLVCRGNLSLASEYQQQWGYPAFGLPGLYLLQYTDASGAALVDQSGNAVPFLIPATNGNPTDADVVSMVLARVANTMGMQGFNPNRIGGTGTIVGAPLTEMPDGWIWNQGESALSYIQRIDSVSLGYRTFESINGNIWRAKITGWPGNAGSPIYNFTEGKDIFQGRSARSIIQLKNAIRVSGYDFGNGLNMYPPLNVAPPNAATAGLYSQPIWTTFSSPMIPRVNSTDAGTGFAAQDVYNYLQDEYNREVVRTTLVTPRDDIIGPGQTHLVTTISGLAGRLGVAEPLWVQRVDITADADSGFSQSIAYIGGGVSGSLGVGPNDGAGSPIDWSSQ